MAKVSIKVVVAGRTYPLSVNENEVDKVQQAATNINKAIQMLQKNYAVKDMRDLLAMSALQLATKSTGSQTEVKVDDTKTIEALEKLSKELDSLGE